MVPSAGRIVLYKLGTDDVAQICRARSNGVAGGNSVKVGDVYPAMIVRAWGAIDGGAVNLKVFLDGNDELWVTSRTEGDHECGWMQPPRV